jgi:hypothetical protein
MAIAVAVAVAVAVTVTVAVAVAVAAAAAVKDVLKCSPVIKQYSPKPFPNLKTKHKTLRKSLLGAKTQINSQQGMCSIAQGDVFKCATIAGNNFDQ